MAVKIDMEKAFDSMEWNFILKIMSTIGFRRNWINWVEQCITTISYSVIINGSPYGFFRPSR